MSFLRYTETTDGTFKVIKTDLESRSIIKIEPTDFKGGREELGNQVISVEIKGLSRETVPDGP